MGMCSVELFEFLKVIFFCFQEREMRLELKEATSEASRIRKEFEDAEAKTTSNYNKEIGSLREQVFYWFNSLLFKRLSR